ncbi:MAG TPA: sigma-70 family RNA polymerase sigma factor [Xanthobacteraceae bacterium]|nr:sigma-70 family RNA polymerase sigma factor [Xanthobacteraceae bacterium]
MTAQTLATTPRRAIADEALVRQMASGHKLAMRALFARHQVKVYRFALRIVRDAALAEDVVSETFIDAWQHADRFEGRSSVSTWLLGIARHKALTAANRRQTESLDCDAAQNVVDTANNPEAELGDRDRGAVVRRCLKALSPEHAEIIDLVYYQEKSIKEIVEILGIPDNTVKTRMFYARKRLATLVAAEGIDRAAA